MNRKKKIILISASIILIIILVLLVFLLIKLTKKQETIGNIDSISKEVSDKQISNFQDVKLIEELLQAGELLDDSIGTDLDDGQKEILRSLGVSDNLIDTYRIYTSEELLNSNFISAETEGEQQVEDWKINYKNEKYIISQSQELAFLVNGREDEKGRIQYARLVEDEELYENSSENFEEDVSTIATESDKTSINIRKVERLKYNVNIDYPDNAVDTKYAVKINDEETLGINTLDFLQEDLNIEENVEDVQQINLDIEANKELEAGNLEQLQMNSETQTAGEIQQLLNQETVNQETVNQEDEVDYDSLEWIDYDGTIFIEENVTIYTKYKLSSDDLDYTIGNSKEVPELILSIPTYEIVEDESSMYIKFSNLESEYNDEVKFKVSYGKKESEEEPIYCDWYEAEEDKFNIEEVGKYYIKFIAVMPNKNVTDSNEMKISIGRLENEGSIDPENTGITGEGTSQIVDTTKEEVTNSSNTKLSYIKLNGSYLPQSIVDSLNKNGTAEYKLSSANSVTIKAYAQDSNATVIGNGIYNFKNNKSTIKIQIAGSDGSKSIFTITVTRSSTTNSNTTNNSSNSNSGNTSTGNSTGTSQSSNTVSSGENTGGTSQSNNTSSNGENSNSGNSAGSSNSGNNTTTVVCNHDWQAATCTTPKKCSKCGITEGSKDPNNHSNYGETSKITQAATCTTAQVTTIYCSGCGAAKRTQQGQALGHSYTAKTTTSTYLKSSATCTTAATYYYACSRCGAKGTTTYTSGNALGHSYTAKTTTSTYLKSSATCTTAATYYYKCSRCTASSKGDTNTTYTLGSELGHSWGTTKYKYSSTSSLYYTHHYVKCTRTGCNQTKPVAHSVNNYSYTKIGTSSTTGYYHTRNYVCICGLQYKNEAMTACKCSYCSKSFTSLSSGSYCYVSGSTVKHRCVCGRTT